MYCAQNKLHDEKESEVRGHVSYEHNRRHRHGLSTTFKDTTMDWHDPMTIFESHNTTTDFFILSYWQTTNSFGLISNLNDNIPKGSCTGHHIPKASPNILLHNHHCHIRLAASDIPLYSRIDWHSRDNIRHHIEMTTPDIPLHITDCHIPTFHIQPNDSTPRHNHGLLSRPIGKTQHPNTHSRTDIS